MQVFTRRFGYVQVSDTTSCKVITHITETIGLLASQIVHHTLAGIKAGTAVVKRSTRAQVPKTYFIYCTLRRTITLIDLNDRLAHYENYSISHCLYSLTECINMDLWLPEWLRRIVWNNPVASDWDLWWVFLFGDVRFCVEGNGGGAGTCNPTIRCFRLSFPFGLKRYTFKDKLVSFQIFALSSSTQQH